MKAKVFIFLRLIISSILPSYGQEELKDIDGNIYKTIAIGTQVWMAENLKTIHYRSGDSIPYVAAGTVWGSQTTATCCNFGNDSRKTMLYNWYAVTNTQNIAPMGWHVPSDAEWTILINYLGGETVAGRKLESLGFGTTGSRNAIGGFEYPDFGDWWSASELSQIKGSHWGHPTRQATIYNIGFDKGYGFAVRCVKDMSNTYLPEESN